MFTRANKRQPALAWPRDGNDAGKQVAMAADGHVPLHANTIEHKKGHCRMGNKEKPLFLPSRPGQRQHRQNCNLCIRSKVLPIYRLDAAGYAGARLQFRRAQGRMERSRREANRY
jgi:hypothetical protein